MNLLPILKRIRRNSLSSLVSQLTDRSGENSFVNLGRNYEEKCRKVLSKLFDTQVKIVGGANDGGIDLIWSKSLNIENKASSSTNNEFIGQCKVKVSNRVAPEVCRALDGVLSKRPPHTVGCLISNFRPSTEAMKLIKYSPFPQIYFNISECAECEYIKEIFVNQKFKELFPHVLILPVRRTIRNKDNTSYTNYIHYIIKFI